MKEYILIELLTKCGEYEFTSYLKREIHTHETDGWAKGLYEAKHFYDDLTHEEYPWFEHNGGEVATRLVRVINLNKDQYDLLGLIM